jgi:hypothetical protein
MRLSRTARRVRDMAAQGTGWATSRAVWPAGRHSPLPAGRRAATPERAALRRRVLRMLLQAAVLRQATLLPSADLAAAEAAEAVMQAAEAVGGTTKLQRIDFVTRRAKERTSADERLFDEPVSADIFCARLKQPRTSRCEPERPQNRFLTARPLVWSPLCHAS